MTATAGHDPLHGKVHLACGRIAGGARAIAEAYRFGVPEGPHPQPWTAPSIRDYEYDVALEWPTGRLAVKASPAMSCYVTPDGATWDPVEIRGVQGCEWTSGVGRYVLKWTEGATDFKYSSFDITGAEAREMLADWDPLE